MNSEPANYGQRIHSKHAKGLRDIVHCCDLGGDEAANSNWRKPEIEMIVLARLTNVK